MDKSLGDDLRKLLKLFQLSQEHVPPQIFDHGDDIIPMHLGLDIGVLTKNGWIIDLEFDKNKTEMQFVVMADRGNWRLKYRCDDKTGDTTPVELFEFGPKGTTDSRYTQKGVMEDRNGMLGLAKLSDEHIKAISDTGNAQ